MKRYMVLSIVLLLLFGSNFDCLASNTDGHVCFRKMDLNKDEIVDFHEFKKIHGGDKDQFDKIDTDGDGRLFHDEYHRYLEKDSS